MSKVPVIKAEKKNKDTDTYYLLFNKEKIFLFNQKHRNGAFDYFKSGKSISSALKPATRDPGLRRVCDKLPMYIKYIEKEYEIKVMR